MCYLPLQFPLELDPWELLQKHVLSDYANNEVPVPMYIIVISPFGTIGIQLHFYRIVGGVCIDYEKLSCLAPELISNQFF